MFHHTRYLLTTGIIVAIILGSIFLLQARRLPISVPSPMGEDIFSPSEICASASQKTVWKTKDVSFASGMPQVVVDTIYQAIDQTSDVRFSKSDAGNGLWWVTEDDWNIIDDHGVAFSIAFSVNEDSVCERVDVVRYPIFQDLNATISDILLKNGFVKNKLNSSSSEDDETFYDYILAFERGNTRCTLVTDAEVSSGSPLMRNEMGPHYTFTCSDQLDASYAEQIPFLRGLNDHDAAVTIDTILGDFARIDIQYRRMGMYAIMLKTDDAWMPILKSQEQPLCSVVRKYQIPVQIYGVPASQYIPSAACFNEDGQLLASPDGPIL